MEAIDAEMEENKNSFTNSTAANKNDPWLPQNQSGQSIPKIIPAPGDPLRNMISSESYVKSLERRLGKIKGKSDVVKPKDMIKSLHEVRELHTSRYLSDSATDSYSDTFSTDQKESVILTVHRRLNPEKQALNPQELVPLVQEDILAKTLAEDENSDVERTSCEKKT